MGAPGGFKNCAANADTVGSTRASGRHEAGRKDRVISLLRRIVRTTVVVPIAALTLAACVPSAPSSVTCSGISGGNSLVLEWCHKRYRYYKLDTSSSFAQQLANSLAATMTSCSGLGSRHSSGGALLAAYPGSTAVAENLFCYGAAPGSCPSPQYGATRAMNAWIASPGHKANLDNFGGAWVNAAGACNWSRGLYFAVGQFHKP